MSVIKRNRFIVLFLIFIILFTAIGCGSKKNIQNTPSQGKPEATDISKNTHNDVQEDSKSELEGQVNVPKTEHQDKAQEKKQEDTQVEKKQKYLQKANEQNEISTKASPQVSLIVRGPEGVGVIIEEGNFKLEENDTVFDVLQRAANKNGIRLDYRGIKSTIYIEGINGLYEFDKGPESGWIYRLNGSIMGKSAGSVKLKDGDKIEWIYTVTLGRDERSEK